jgi:hypothetical protein
LRRIAGRRGRVATRRRVGPLLRVQANVVGRIRNPLGGIALRSSSAVRPVRLRRTALGSQVCRRLRIQRRRQDALHVNVAVLTDQSRNELLTQSGGRKTLKRGAVAAG